MLPQLYLQEALRLFPSVPFFGRKLTEDCKFGEMTTVNIWLSILFSVFWQKRGPLNHVYRQMSNIPMYT